MSFAFSALDELRVALPKIAKVLHTQIDKLSVLHDCALPLRTTRHDRYRDRVVSVDGLTDEIPFIQSGSLHVQKRYPYPGFGIILMENSLDQYIRYVIFSTQDTQGLMRRWVVIKKGEVRKLYRNLMRACRLSCEMEPPVLAQGLLEDVVQNTVGFLSKAKEIAKYGARIQRGVIIHGTPGNGKTMLCRYIQNLCGKKRLTWSIVTASDIEKAVGENTLDVLFRRSNVTFFDDIDISYFSRSSGGNAQKACAILTAMDGMFPSGNAVRIFTTNEGIEDFDRAFMRPGRIDRAYCLTEPDRSMRERLIKSWPTEILENIDYDFLIDASEACSFAEIEGVRASLVTVHVLENKWDLNRALENLNCRRQEKKRGGVGFAA